MTKLSRKFNKWRRASNIENNNRSEVVPEPEKDNTHEEVLAEVVPEPEKDNTHEEVLAEVVSDPVSDSSNEGAMSDDAGGKSDSNVKVDNAPDVVLPVNQEKITRPKSPKDPGAKTFAQIVQTKVTDFFKTRHQTGRGAGEKLTIDPNEVPGTSAESDRQKIERAKKQLLDKPNPANDRLVSSEDDADVELQDNPANDSPVSSQDDADVDVDEDDDDNFEWALVKETNNRRFNASERVYNLVSTRVRDVRGSVSQILDAIGTILRKFIAKLKEDKTMQPRDFVRLVILSPELQDPIAIPWVLVQDWSVEAILELIEKVMQSNKKFFLHPGVTFVVKHVHNPHGGKGGWPIKSSTKKNFVNRRGVL